MMPAAPRASARGQWAGRRLALVVANRRSWVHACSAALVACGGTVAPPDATVHALTEAMGRGDCDAILSLAHDDGTWDRAACESDLASLRAQAAAMEVAEAPEVVALLPVTSATSASLTRVGRRWRLAAPVATTIAPATPLDALHGLLQAIEAGGASEITRWMTTEQAATWGTDLETVRAAIAQVGSAEVSVYGQSAAVTVGEVTVRLLLGRDGWRVSGIDLPVPYDAYYEDW